MSSAGVAADFGDYKKQSFGEKLKAMFCCGEYDEEYESARRPTLQISHPTNFRRETIPQIAGLTAEEAQEIRDRQLRDAARMWHSLQPLHSSPSGTFAERPSHAGTPSFEQFTQPRPAPPTPGSTPILPAPERWASPVQRHGDMGSSRLERIRTHSRKISDSLRVSSYSKGSEQQQFSSRHYPAVCRESDSAVEMRALMSFADSGMGNGSKPNVMVRSREGSDNPKMSEESFSQSERESKDEKERFDSGIGRGLEYRL